MGIVIHPSWAALDDLFIVTCCLKKRVDDILTVLGKCTILTPCCDDIRDVIHILRVAFDDGCTIINCEEERDLVWIVVGFPQNCLVGCC